MNLKTLYIDCLAGVSGNMLMGMLLDLGYPFEKLNSDLTSLGLDGYELICGRAARKGVSALHFDVELKGGQSLRTLPVVLDALERSGLPGEVKRKSASAFQRLARVEADAHGIELEKVHFHEIGALDSIVDITGFFLGLEFLGIEKILSSPVNVGSGTVTFSHGTFSVPAPATAELLKNVPIYSRFEGELTTPTGALLLTESASRFGPIPSMILEKQGWGAGREMAHPNVLRGLLGWTESEAKEPVLESIAQIEVNLDDMNPEAFSYFFEKAFEEGALDVFTIPIGMKKNRPAVALNVLCPLESEGRMRDLIFRETSALGARRRCLERWVLPRESAFVSTSFGDVAVKYALHDGAVRSAAPEYESCRELARKNRVSFLTVMDAAREAALREHPAGLPFSGESK